MITNINHITLAVQNIERSFEFYKNILGFKPLVKWENGAYFLVGDEQNGDWFCLNFDKNRKPTSCYTHYAFSVSPENFNLMSEAIIKSGVHIFKENSSPGDSLYFLDPDGHKLEIHASNWQQRIKAKQLEIGSWKEVVWYV